MASESVSARKAAEEIYGPRTWPEGTTPDKIFLYSVCYSQEEAADIIAAACSPVAPPPDVNQVHDFLGKQPWAGELNKVTKKLSGEEMAFIARCLWETFYLGRESSGAAPAVSTPLPENLIEVIDNGQHGLSWTLRINFPGNPWEEEFADGHDCAEAAEDWRKRLAQFFQPAPAQPQWISVKERLPEDDADVFAAIWWNNRDNPEYSGYQIHDCLYYEGGPGSGQKIFADCEGEEFEHTDVQFWIYKKDLAATVPPVASPQGEGK